MDFRFTEEEKAFRQEVRQWLTKEIPPRWTELDPWFWEETDESWDLCREFQRKLGQKGWLAPAYPKKYGGSEMSHINRLILGEEMTYTNAPFGVEAGISVNWVGPTILLYGTEAQKDKYVKGVARGDIVFCLGYSEPNAGSDLASLETRAVEDGDEYVINGHKIWTSYGHYADYCWLAARTDPNVRKHRGISMFIVDMKAPGITVQPIINILNHHSFNEVFFDNVRIPKENLVGEKNKGWYQLMVALDFERSPIDLAITTGRIIEDLVQYCQQTKRNGEVLAKNPLIRHQLAQVAIENEVCRMMSYRLIWMYSANIHPSYEASMTLLFASESMRHLANVAMHIFGPYGQLEMDSKWAVLKGRIMRLSLNCLSIGVGGGANEIQRNIIATRGLGLPR